jgi:hypothetical protein
MKELHIKGENTCKITKETCIKKILCKDCIIAINYKKNTCKKENNIVE